MQIECTSCTKDQLKLSLVTEKKENLLLKMQGFILENEVYKKMKNEMLPSKQSLNEILLYYIRMTITKLFEKANKLQKMNNLKFLQKLQFFKNWDPDELNLFNNELENVTFKPGDHLYNQGDATLMFFIVK